MPETTGRPLNNDPGGRDRNVSPEPEQVLQQAAARSRPRRIISGLLLAVGWRAVGWAWALLGVVETAGSAAGRPWIEWGPTPAWAQTVLLAAGTSALLFCLVRPPVGRRGRTAAGCGFGVVAVVGLAHAAVFYSALARGVVRTCLPIPFGLVVAGLAAAQAWAVVRGRWTRRSGRRWIAAEALCGAAALGALVLAQIVVFGCHTHVQRADAIVVFGARVYEDGTPSLALWDRVRTACDLYHSGLAPVVVVSGGRGDTGPDEPAVMKELALGWGVPEEALALDSEGENTWATVENAGRLMREKGWGRALMVSHYYHLSRIDLACRRAGVCAFTAPARQTRRLRLEPYYVAREVAAWLFYSVRTIWQPTG